MQLDLFEFDKSDRISKYIFESPYIKFFDLDTDEVFESKLGLRIRRKIRGKGKLAKIVFAVEEDWWLKGDKEGISSGSDVDFPKEEEAIEFFVSEAKFSNFCLEKNKENIVFDNRRYFWKINDKGERIERL